MRVRKKLALSFALSGVLGGLALSSSPAMAQSASPAHLDSSASCPAHSLCLYSLGDYVGTQWAYTYGNHPSNVWLYVGSGANDQAYSFYNQRVWTSELAENSPATTNAWSCYVGVGGIPYLNEYGWTNGAWNFGASGAQASISSYALLSSAPGCTWVQN